MMQKVTGGLIEALFLGQAGPNRWNVLLKNLGRYTGELVLVEEPQTTARVVRTGEGGEYELEISTSEPALNVLSRVGRMPLPPYIKRTRGHDERDDADRERYQTVYAKEPGSVAAPTAGLHFTPALMEQLKAAGVEQAYVTLHVGLGTFRPVSAERLEEHAMHSESYSLSPETAAVINRAKAEGRRVIAVGTTAARVLESQPTDEFQPKTADTSIFIYPPYQWRHVDALITNFHLPKSTLIALVAALVGLDEQRRVYAEAIANRYRFFSYGDSSFLD